MRGSVNRLVSEGRVGDGAEGEGDEEKILGWVEETVEED